MFFYASQLKRSLVTMFTFSLLASGVSAEHGSHTTATPGESLIFSDQDGWWSPVVVRLSSEGRTALSSEVGDAAVASTQSLPVGGASDSIELVECQYPVFLEGREGEDSPLTVQEVPLPPERPEFEKVACTECESLSALPCDVGYGCASASCAPVECAPCCTTNCCGPTCTVALDAIFLNRVDPDGDLALVFCNTCADVYKGRDFDLDTAAAPRIRIFREFATSGCGSSCGCGASDCGDPCGCGSSGYGGCAPCCESYTLEASYYNLDGWSDKRTLTGDLTLFGVTNLGPNSTAIVLYDSSLQSLEMNVRKPHGCWSNLIAGVRWLQLDEYSAVSGVGAVLNDARTVGLTNNLYGAHVGMQRLLYDQGGMLTVDATVKTGVALNDINRHISGFGTNPSKDKTNVSFIGDLEFQANFEVTCNWTVTAGYQMLFLTGMAEASEQFFSPTEIIGGRFLFYHGANVGLAYSF